MASEAPIGTEETQGVRSETGMDTSISRPDPSIHPLHVMLDDMLVLSCVSSPSQWGGPAGIDTGVRSDWLWMHPRHANSRGSAWMNSRIHAFAVSPSELHLPEVERLSQKPTNLDLFHVTGAL